jgi:hypothetical protein
MTDVVPCHECQTLGAAVGLLDELFGTREGDAGPELDGLVGAFAEGI